MQVAWLGLLLQEKSTLHYQLVSAEPPVHRWLQLAEFLVGQCAYETLLQEMRRAVTADRRMLLYKLNLCLHANHNSHPFALGALPLLACRLFTHWGALDSLHSSEP